MARCLITGGAGFIGSHIADALVARGDSVRVLDNLSSGRKENLIHIIDRIEFIEGDIRDVNIVQRAMKGVDCVFHQAALRSVPRSMEMPREYNDVNINGTLNLLIAARDAKVKRFVFASSSSVYGDTDKLPENESDPPKPISPYAMTKLIGEQYCKLFYDAYGLETVSLRYFNVFGPRQNLDSDYAVVIPKFISCMLKNESPPVFGDGLQTRDFTYVDNVVEANLLAMNSTAGSGEVYNVAAGNEKSVLNIVEGLNNLMRKNIKPKFLPIRAGDIKCTRSDPSKIKKDLGWNLKVDFDSGLERTLHWFKECLS